MSLVECKKCRSSDVDINYIKDDELIDSSSIKKIETEFVSSSEYDFYFKLKAKKEHLLSTCGNCGFKERLNIPS